METEQTEAVIIEFNYAINAQDIARLGRCMTDDHSFIDAAGNSVAELQMLDDIAANRLSLLGGK